MLWGKLRAWVTMISDVGETSWLEEELEFLYFSLCRHFFAFYEYRGKSSTHATVTLMLINEHKTFISFRRVSAEFRNVTNSIIRVWNVQKFSLDRYKVETWNSWVFPAEFSSFNIQIQRIFKILTLWLQPFFARVLIWASETHTSRSNKFPWSLIVLIFFFSRRLNLFFFRFRFHILSSAAAATAKPLSVVCGKWKIYFRHMKMLKIERCFRHTIRLMFWKISFLIYAILICDIVS